MSQTSSESPDGPPPPRQRPAAARSPKDSSELDLWDFDEDAPAKPAPEAPSAAEQESLPEIKPRPRAIDPSPRRAALPERESTSPKRNPAPRSPSQPIELKRKPTDDIGELDGDWAEPEAAASEPASPSVSLSKDSPSPESPALQEPVAVEEPAISTEEAAEEVATTESGPAVNSPHALRNLLKFSKTEAIGLGAFALVLLTTAIVLIMLAKNRLPTTNGDEGKIVFPVKGSQVTLKKVTSFWREPVIGKDSARRDTKLIPVVTIETEGGPAALRIFFKDDKGETVGDSSTLSTASGTLEIAATAGLDDLGMHAAYRTGETRPWKIEILEAPSTESSSQQFRPLLVIPVSTDRH